MPNIIFQSSDGSSFHVISGSGLGFYGSGFGYSVPVGQFPSRTFITNGAGSAQGPEVNNCKRASTTGVIVGQTGTPILLTQIPNYQSTLNIRFSGDAPCSVQNASVRIYDRSNIDNNPSGVTCYVAEVIHTGVTQVTGGLGDSTWVNVRGSTTTLSLQDTPGQSGLTPGTSGIWHDWYLAISPSPDSVGSKTNFGLYFSLEYL